MPKKHKQKKPPVQAQPVKHFLKCDECGHITEISVVPFSIVKPRRRLDCNCAEYAATFVPAAQAIDQFVRQQVEAAA
ncbi:hypothetical protein EV128_125102 [Rhizobium azibense]|nr:hypothetical protein EV128_125102 [Rhizobium azibense]